MAAGGLGSTIEIVSSRSNAFVEGVMGVLLAAMTLLAGAQIGGRFVFGYSIFWSDELARFLLIWVSFLGISVGVRRSAHPGVDTLVRALPSRWARPALLAALFLALLFFGVMVWYGAALVARTWPQRSTSLGLRMGIPYLAVPVAGGLMALHALALGLGSRRSLERGSAPRD